MSSGVIEKRTTPAHIYCTEPAGERQHVLDPSCWCEPVRTWCQTRDVFWHSGKARPSVLNDQRRKRFPAPVLEEPEPDPELLMACPYPGCPRVLQSKLGLATHRRRAHEGWNPKAVTP